MNLVTKFKNAFNGLKSGLKQPAIQLQVFLALVAIVTFLILKISYYEWLVVLVMIALVCLCEWINSIFEATVDYISLKEHPTAKLIKDLGAGMVLLAAFFAFLCGVIIIINNLR